MKFGKRLLREASRRWAHSYIDYKQLKHAIKLDVVAQDARGTRFEVALRLELRKVAVFYVEKEMELAAAVGHLSHASSPAEVTALRGELHDLRKFVVLNHYAVVKAAKKRNRHLRAACGEGCAPLRAVTVLSQQRFFTSTKLAALATQAEILAQELAPRQPPAAEVLQEYQCPICLDILRSPVLLTCAHRYCWACLLAHSAAARSGCRPGAKFGDAKQQQQQVAAAELLPGSSTTFQEQEQQQEGQQEQWEVANGLDDEQVDACTTLDCPVCRKAQLLNLDRLQVDPHLDAFLQKLERQQRIADSSTASSSAYSSQAATTTSTGAGRGSAPIPIAGRRAAGEAEDMVVDAKPSTSTISLAEASELAEAAAASAAADAEEAQQQAAAGGATAGAVLTPMVVAVPPSLPFVDGEAPLLPPQAPEHAGRLVVCLDLDGTLVTTFAPKRAPMLPLGSASYIVGRGGMLNPNGVFVVERPGLGDFLHRITAFSEVVLFTAGLEDYAKPICDAIESRYPGCFHHRLYRPATVAEDIYPCIKDMSRLGRDLPRCVLVDDTPLAFFRQPQHGIPVLQFRGDIDDRMLPEAVAPLLESLHGCADVAVPLSRRFNMQKWFQAQGLTPSLHAMHHKASLPQLKLTQLRVPPALGTAPRGSMTDACAAEGLRQNVYEGTLLVCDFDKTLVDFDAGERLCDELAPELTSLLSSQQMPANFVPVTNIVLSEMQRRGVSRDRLVSCLLEIGREVPLAMQRMLPWAVHRGMETVVLSDCNSVFIGHILTGARLNTYVRQIITNQASFQQVAPPAPAAAALLPSDSSGEADVAAVEEPALPPAVVRPSHVPSGFGSGWFFRSAAATSSTNSGSTSVGYEPPAAPINSHRLVIKPRHDYKSCGNHGCALCPANMCKGAELVALRAAAPYRARRVVYCGDGTNDFCAALQLGPQDVLLARGGHGLERLVAERAAAAAADSGVRRVVASVHVWHTHEDLYRLVQQHAA